jgi:hypothetical protein
VIGAGAGCSFRLSVASLPRSLVSADALRGRGTSTAKALVLVELFEVLGHPLALGADGSPFATQLLQEVRL